MARKVSIKVGDRVGYRVAFLRSIGMAHSDMSRGRGKVTKIDSWGKTTQIATVAWEKGADLPEQINVQNLAKVGSLAFTSEDQ